jgi:hypothetical protein
MRNEMQEKAPELRDEVRGLTVYVPIPNVRRYIHGYISLSLYLKLFAKVVKVLSTMVSTGQM